MEDRRQVQEKRITIKSFKISTEKTGAEKQADIKQAPKKDNTKTPFLHPVNLLLSQNYPSTSLSKCSPIIPSVLLIGNASSSLSSTQHCQATRSGMPREAFRARSPSGSR
jgi:hypothetical protein